MDETPPRGVRGNGLVLREWADGDLDALVALLENYQQADGSVRVPDVLRAAVGKDVIVPRRQG